MNDRNSTWNAEEVQEFMQWKRKGSLYSEVSLSRAKLELRRRDRRGRGLDPNGARLDQTDFPLPLGGESEPSKRGTGKPRSLWSIEAVKRTKAARLRRAAERSRNRDHTEESE